MLLVFCFIPSVTFASFHEYVCSDMESAGGSPSCALDVFTMSGVDVYYDNSPLDFPLTSGQTWYFSGTITGTGNLAISCKDPGSWTGLVPGTYVDEPLTSCLDSVNNKGLYFNPQVNTFTGSIYNICVSDTIGECSPGIIPSEEATTTPINHNFETFQNVSFILFGLTGVYFAKMIIGLFV